MEELLTAPMWMTPNVPNGGRHVPPELVASKGAMEDGTKRTVGLESQTKYWATPDCNTSTYSNGKMGPNIREQAASWNANSAATHSPNPAGATVTGGGRKHMDQLANFVAYTPLDYLRPDPQTQDGPASLTELHGSPPPSTRRLNPYFTEWLMGWPIGHTIAEPSASSASEMASWRCKLQQRLSCLFAE